MDCHIAKTSGHALLCVRDQWRFAQRSRSERGSSQFGGSHHFDSGVPPHFRPRQLPQCVGPVSLRESTRLPRCRPPEQVCETAKTASVLQTISEFGGRLRRFGWSNECRKLKRKLLEAVRLTMLSFDAFMRAITADLAGQE